MIEFLKAIPKQAEILRHIARKSKQHWGYNADYMKLWNYDLTLTPQFIANNPVYYALVDDQIVGFYGFELQVIPVNLKHFWVIPGSVGMGIGKLMFSHAVKYLTLSDVDLFQVVAEPNAEGFYLQMGGRKVGSKSMSSLEQVFPVIEFAVAFD